MKSNVRKIFLILLCAALVVGVLTACASTPKIEPPTGLKIDMENAVFSWDSVDSAIRYEVKVDEMEYVVYEPSYTLEIYDYDEHTLSVRTVTMDGKSEYSTSLLYARDSAEPSSGLKMLSAPDLSMTANRVLWNNVQNNNGYKVYFNNQVIKVAKNVNYCDLTFPQEEGVRTYLVQVRTLGDKITYDDSLKSASYSVTVTDGKANLLSLTAQSIFYEPATRTIKWYNRPTADSIAYEIYRNGVLEATVDADDKATMSYAPVLNGTEISYTMRLVSKSGLYNPSAKSAPITFPLQDSAVTELRLDTDEEGAFAFVWKESAYSVSYSLLLDGEPFGSEIGTLLTNTLSVGRHVARVKAVGDGVYYKDSPYSEEFVFYIEQNKLPCIFLDAPDMLSAEISEGTLTATATEVKDATSYLFKFLSGETEWVFESDAATLAITATTINGKLLSKESADRAAALLSATADVITVSAAAKANVNYYKTSTYSAEIVLGDGVVLSAPEEIGWTPKGLSWQSVNGAIRYEVVFDGESTETESVSFAPESKTGDHVVKVRAIAEENVCLFSKELFLRLPTEIAPPTDLQVTSGVLSFVGATNAAWYRLYLNGEELDVLGARTTDVTLSEYEEFTYDGVYTLMLRSIAPSDYYADSVLSAEIIYHKTDGAYGTEFKPYQITTAEEFVQLLSRYNDAYFTLTREQYDFAGVDLSPLSQNTFNGTLWGNHATLKNLQPIKSLFAELEGATISDIAFEMELSAFACNDEGCIARRFVKSVLHNVTLKVKGERTVDGDVTFGFLAYESKELTLEDVSLQMNFDLTASGKATVGVLAYALEGAGDGVRTSGNFTLRAKETVLCGISVTGELAFTNYETTLAMTADAGEHTLLFAGGAARGNVTLTSSVLNGTALLAADRVQYYGVTLEKAELSFVTVGGKGTIEARRIEAYGVVNDGANSLHSVTCSTELTATASEDVLTAGIAKTISEDMDAEKIRFAGTWKVSAPEVMVGGIAYRAIGTVGGAAENIARAENCVSAGRIEVAGAEAQVAGGVIYAQDVDVAFDGALILLKNITTSGKVGGVSLSASGVVTASGTLSFTAEKCKALSVAGMASGADQSVNADELSLSGSLEAETLTFGGVSDRSNNLAGSVKALGVSLTVKSDGFAVGGVLAYGENLSLSQSNVNVNITAQGTGKLAGFAVDIGDHDAGNISVRGKLALSAKNEETSEVCGAVCQAGVLTGVDCQVNITAQGAALVSGIAGSVAGFKGSVALRNAELAVTSDRARVCGVVRDISSGAVLGTVSSVIVHVSPLTEESSYAEVFGYTEEASASSGFTMSDVTFDIGRFATARFAGIADNARGSFENCTLSYALTCAAASSEIGGAFNDLSGSASVSMGTAVKPVKMTVTGETLLGGVVCRAATASITKSNLLLAITLDLAENGANFVGGAIAEAEGAVSLQKSVVTLTVDRKGGGSLLLGGAAAKVVGSLSDAKVNLTVKKAVASDKVGGVAALVENGSLTRCLAMGEVAAANAGGVVSQSNDSTLAECASLMRLSDALSAGIAFSAKNVTLRNCYSLSRVPNGAGLVYEGKKTRFETVYFGGIAKYALADSLSADCTADTLFAEASLRATPAVEKGSAPFAYAYKTLAYGYDGDDFDTALWEVSTEKYPYLKSLGENLAQPSVTPETLDGILPADGENIYDLAPAFVNADAPAVVWVVAEGSAIAIQDGIVTFKAKGEGVLYGYLSGGVKVYELPYSVGSFAPFEGSGTEANPYLLPDLTRFSYVPSVALAYAAETGNTAYFKLAEDTYENVVFPDLSDKSFAFHFDFNGSVLVSPEIPACGIFNALTGGSVRNLTIRSHFATENVLFAEGTDVAVSGVTVQDLALESAQRLIGEMTGGTLADISVFVRAEGEEASFAVVGKAIGINATRVQLFAYASSSDTFEVSFAAEAEDSAFARCMLLGYVDWSAAGDAVFALTAKDTNFENCAALYFAEITTETPLSLVRTADNVTFSGVSVALNGVFTPTVGVTQRAYGELKSILSAAPYSFAGESIPTPLGYALFEEDTDGDFIVVGESGEELASLIISGKSELSLTDNVIAVGETPFSEAASYSVTADLADVSDGVLRLKKNGSGVLTVTNVFGKTCEISITITEFSGFAAGAGTEESPYEITSLDDFMKIKYHSGEYYALKSDLSGEITEPFAFDGYLSGENHTLTFTLSAGALFADFSGSMQDVSFNLSFTGAVETENGGVFARSCYSAALTNVSFAFGAISLTVADGASAGLLFGETDGMCALDQVTVTLGKTYIAAGAESKVGLLVGRAEDSLFTDITLTAEDVTLAMNGVFGGIVGELGGFMLEDELMSDVTLRLVLTATSIGAPDTLKVGGAIGWTTVTVSGVTADVDLTVGDSGSPHGEVTVGGIVGETRSSLKQSSVTGNIAVYAALGKAGGAVGKGGSESTLNELTTDVALLCDGAKAAYAGGIVGKSGGNLYGVNTSATVTAIGRAGAGDLASLSEEENVVIVIAAAGGIAGYYEGYMTTVSADGATVTATATYAGEDAYALAGAVAGYLSNAMNVEAKTSAVTASGAVSAAGGSIGLLGGSMQCAVVSDITLSATEIGGVVGAFALSTGASLSDIVSAVSVGASEGAIVGRVLRAETEDEIVTGKVSDCYYLYGNAIGMSVAAAYNVDNTKSADISEFYGDVIYENFNEEIWLFDVAAIATLK